MHKNWGQKFYVMCTLSKFLVWSNFNFTWFDSRKIRINTWEYIIEIIDIEYVLLSFLSKNFVSTKWRISKDSLTRGRLLRQGISRGCEQCELFFEQNLQKRFNIETWNGKQFHKGHRLCKKSISFKFSTKSNSSDHT